MTAESGLVVGRLALRSEVIEVLKLPARGRVTVACVRTKRQGCIWSAAPTLNCFGNHQAMGCVLQLLVPHAPLKHTCIHAVWTMRVPLVVRTCCCFVMPAVAPCTGVATERAQFMDLVRQQITQLQDTHGTESTSLTFTGGGLHAVRPEEESELVRTGSVTLETRSDSMFLSFVF